MTLSVRDISERYAVKEHTVLAWIRSGELRALNLARTANGRPRYSIDVVDLERFERARTVIPDGGLSTTQKLRRRAAGSVKEFF